MIDYKNHDPLFDCFAILGCHQQSTEQELKYAHRDLCMQYHPDRSGEGVDAERFHVVQRAYALAKVVARRELLVKFNHYGVECSACAASGVDRKSIKGLGFRIKACVKCSGAGWVRDVRR